MQATVSLVTVHDIATTYRSGLLQLSHGVVSYASGGPSSKVRPCFYHLSLPGHDNISDPSPASAAAKDWTMDSLASKVNRCVRALNVQGRYVLVGEGAGANVVTRAACEERQRDIDAYNSLSKAPQTGGMLTGLVLVQPDFDGPTVGQNLSAMLGGWMMR